ncbi:COG3969 Predicted phosphoadenosine phosphosulfate sulfotransferase [uncultured Caudovirales phage]|uniref:COG3969 Predicted phosphoadenosine phosphosulfate sulfotransferase n=1 Tax=uncultured Caudovirales phage TaxID=2100421 RepID=A0A6J5P9M0_9CAUD|nr:COG3969 Predicted phosphoadenosine phosphosulfate sulfotransferase [uncultured Caudovirales phage]
MAKRYLNQSVLQASRDRISKTLDNVERAYVAFSGGKDSSVMMHLVMDEAIKRGIKVGIMYIDFEAQYKDTITHINEMVELYKDHIDMHWICIPILLRNALTNFEPRWVCWDEDNKDLWIRQKPEVYNNEKDYPFAIPKMEFEEFIVLFGQWYGQGKKTAGFIGIRAQESLHRYCAVATWEKRDLTLNGWRWTTKIVDDVYNVYPIYDWQTEDIWRYHAQNPEKPHNSIYDKMQMAGVPLSQQRLCQPFGDDQRRGLWLYHIIEPETWFKLVCRVNGANSGSLYIEETGNINGYNKISKPPGHTWKSFCNMLLSTMPKRVRGHYSFRFKKFIKGWHDRGYTVIPDEAPPELEAKCWAPSWRRMCKVLLRNDYWCKGLGQTQPKSDAYLRFKEMKKAKKLEEAENIPEFSY